MWLCPLPLECSLGFGKVFFESLVQVFPAPGHISGGCLLGVGPPCPQPAPRDLCLLADLSLASEASHSSTNNLCVHKLHSCHSWAFLHSSRRWWPWWDAKTEEDCSITKRDHCSSHMSSIWAVASATCNFQRIFSCPPPKCFIFQVTQNLSARKKGKHFMTRNSSFKAFSFLQWEYHRHFGCA